MKPTLDGVLADTIPAAKRPRESIETRADGSMSIELDGTFIHTKEQLFEKCQINPAEWRVLKLKISAWGGWMTPPAFTEVMKTSAGTDWPAWQREQKNTKPLTKQLFSVRAELAPLHEVMFAAREIEKLRVKAASYAPRYPKVKRRAKRIGNLGEYAQVDHHFGALIWGKETGADDYDLQAARSSGESSTLALIERTRHLSLDEAIIVLGNDQQNADNRMGTTEKGTPQSMDSRYQKVFAASRDWSIWAVDQIREIAPKVTVVIVPGNHDPLASWHLGDSLASWFRRCPSVTVDNSPNGRKYRQHGRVMLMWTHGNHGKLEDYGATMAAEQPDMWGATRWREAHTGDKHHRRLLELKGATVRILPSLRPPCAWASENHFIGSIRAAEAYVWNADEGLISTATYSILGGKP